MFSLLCSGTQPGSMGGTSGSEWGPIGQGQLSSTCGLCVPLSHPPPIFLTFQSDWNCEFRIGKLEFSILLQ